MGSRAKTSTASNSTSNYYDNRQVNDAGGGIIGTGNTLDASQTWQQFTDASSTSNWTDSSTSNWTDASTQTANWSDSSNRSQTWTDNSTVTVTDGGAVAAMSELGAAQTSAAQAIAADAIKAARDSAATVSASATRSQENAIQANTAALQSALGFANSTAGQAFASSTEAMGWAGEAFDKLTGLTGQVLDASKAAGNTAAQGVAGAYASAASQANGNKTLTIAALAAVAIVAAFVVARKAKA